MQFYKFCCNLNSISRSEGQNYFTDVTQNSFLSTKFFLASFFVQLCEFESYQFCIVSRFLLKYIIRSTTASTYKISFPSSIEATVLIEFSSALLQRMLIMFLNFP